MSENNTKEFNKVEGGETVTQINEDMKVIEGYTNKEQCIDSILANARDLVMKDESAHIIIIVAGDENGGVIGSADLLTTLEMIDMGRANIVAQIVGGCGCSECCECKCEGEGSSDED